MLWEVEIRPAAGQIDREGDRVLAECVGLGLQSVASVDAARSFLLQGELSDDLVTRISRSLLSDGVAETFTIHPLAASDNSKGDSQNGQLLNVLFKDGVTDNVANSALKTLQDQDVPVEAVATCRKYRVSGNASETDIERLSAKVLSNDAIEHVVTGPLQMDRISLGDEYEFKLKHVVIREMDDDALKLQSEKGQLYLSIDEMVTIKQHFVELDRDPTDVELETVAQTWSEHCSHKTLAGRISYEDENGPQQFENMLKETIFAATHSNRTAERTPVSAASFGIHSGQVWVDVPSATRMCSVSAHPIILTTNCRRACCIPKRSPTALSPECVITETGWAFRRLTEPSTSMSDTWGTRSSTAATSR